VGLPYDTGTQGRPLNVINEAARFIEKTGGEVKKGTDQVKQGGKR